MSREEALQRGRDLVDQAAATGDWLPILDQLNRLRITAAMAPPPAASTATPQHVDVDELARRAGAK